MLHLPVRRSLSAVLVFGALSWGLVACGSDSDSSAGASDTPTAAESTESAEATGCADLAVLEGSLSSLKDVDLQQDGVAGLTSAIAEVKADLEAAKSSVSTALQPQVDEVTAAFDALETATTGLTTDTVREQAPAILAALQQIATATTDLTTSVSQSCPES